MCYLYRTKSMYIYEDSIAKHMRKIAKGLDEVPCLPCSITNIHYHKD
jgi:hypothetical protein